MEKTQLIETLYKAMTEAWQLSDEAWNNDRYILSSDYRELAINIGNFMTEVVDTLEIINR